MLTFICLWRAGGSVRHTCLGVFKNQSILHFEAKRLFFPSWPSMRQDGYRTEQWLSPSFLSLLNGLRSLPLCSVQSPFTHQHHLPYGAPSSVFIYEHLFHSWMDVVPGMPLWAVFFLPGGWLSWWWETRLTGVSYPTAFLIPAPPGLMGSAGWKSQHCLV